MVSKKPKNSGVAYEYEKTGNVLVSKPASSNQGEWTDRSREGENYNLFVYGKNMGVDMDGRSLVKLEHVDFSDFSDPIGEETASQE
jgi:hypothetical protein